MEMLSKLSFFRAPTILSCTVHDMLLLTTEMSFIAHDLDKWDIGSFAGTGWYYGPFGAFVHHEIRSYT
jgi:hypothetical protein